ncbi:MAG: hypothetical protein COX43_01730 [Parcubacteria group bacterium CG23_combo_of_CG06-09_8_20_14_all_35_9]|nr:MAG: hypothetical protein COX43_01730 [Parcubacteria group bacterium CG23_combo_of_CG06-09_8_20_14_all_35_9]
MTLNNFCVILKLEDQRTEELKNGRTKEQKNIRTEELKNKLFIGSLVSLSLSSFVSKCDPREKRGELSF